MAIASSRSRSRKRTTRKPVPVRLENSLVIFRAPSFLVPGDQEFPVSAIHAKRILTRGFHLRALKGIDDSQARLSQGERGRALISGRTQRILAAVQFRRARLLRRTLGDRGRAAQA